jgi:hypothetical protein
MQRISHLADAVVTARGSEMAMAVIPFLGFKETSTLVSEYVRTVRPLARLRDVDRLDWRVTARFGRDLFRATIATSVRDQHWRACRIAANQLAGASIPWPKATLGSAVFERTTAVMSYFLRCPAVPIELFAVSKDEQPLGYFCSYTQTRRRGWPIAGLRRTMHPTGGQ